MLAYDPRGRTISGASLVPGRPPVREPQEMKITAANASIALCLVALCATRGGAQNLMAHNAPVSSDSALSNTQVQPSDSTPPWITRRELIGAGLSVLATIAVSPLDKPVANELQEQRWQGNEALHSTTQALAFAGGPGPFYVGVGFFALGKLARAPGLAAAGEHITESVLLAASLTALGKGIAGRALPGVQTSESFEWARGFHRGNGPFVSFPSGHTAAAFALASSLTEESEAWHPGAGRYVGPASYALASAIGLARLYQHVHWVSDLPLAAAIGTWSGLSVESHVHRHGRGSAIKRIAASATVQRAPGGETMVGVSMAFGGAGQ